MVIHSQRIVHISVTGHRFIDTSRELSNSVRIVLDTINKKYTESEFLVYSALAEGSDQLIAKIALKNPAYKLVVPLPLTIEKYLLDFQSDSAIQSFHQFVQAASNIIQLPGQLENHFAYQQLGNYLVENCDILITIWNGEYTGETGGSGEVVKSALLAEKPVFWIYGHNEKNTALNNYKNRKLPGEIEILNAEYWTPSGY